MFESHIPPFFWPEALATANYLTNRLPQQKLKHKTPKDVLQSFFNNPIIHELPPRIFGCTVYVHLPSRSRNKLEPRDIKCIFVGYGTSQKGYRCFDPLHNLIYTTMDCEFFETTFYYNQPRCQGEMSHDHLSWLTHSPALVTDPTEQLGNTTAESSENIVNPPCADSPISDSTGMYPNSETVLDYSANINKDMI